jgi:hypothetical protein
MTFASPFTMSLAEMNVVKPASCRRQAKVPQFH